MPSSPPHHPGSVHAPFVAFICCELDSDKILLPNSMSVYLTVNEGHRMKARTVARMLWGMKARTDIWEGPRQGSLPGRVRVRVYWQHFVTDQRLGGYGQGQGVTTLVRLVWGTKTSGGLRRMARTEARTKGGVRLSKHGVGDEGKERGREGTGKDGKDRGKDGK